MSSFKPCPGNRPVPRPGSRNSSGGISTCRSWPTSRMWSSEVSGRSTTPSSGGTTDRIQRIQRRRRGLRPGARARRATPWSMPPCANSMKQATCTTDCAWSRRVFSPKTWAFIGRPAKPTSPRSCSTSIYPPTTAGGSGPHQRAAMPNPISESSTP